MPGQRAQAGSDAGPHASRRRNEGQIHQFWVSLPPQHRAGVGVQADISRPTAGDPHVSLPTLALEKRGCDRCCSGVELRALLSVIEVNVFMDRAARSTSQAHDHDQYSEESL